MCYRLKNCWQLLILCGMLDSAVAIAMPSHTKQFSLHTGHHDRARETRGYAIDEETEPAFREIIQVTGAPWIRIRISDYNLGSNSYVTFTSLQDGGQQRHDSQTLTLWNGQTAFFNGDAVEVSLYVAQGDANIYLNIDNLTIGEWVDGAPHDGGIAAPCGEDNRQLSSDARVGRIAVSDNGLTPWCTAWLVANGALLTAGHCVDNDPDGDGPQTPNGVADTRFVNGVVEFNVPPSRNDGTPVLADPDDQYPIESHGIQFEFAGNGAGQGKDWALFKCGRNSTTALRPIEVQRSFFRMSDAIPTPFFSMIRVTGYGQDNSPPDRNQVQQTNAGQYESRVAFGGGIWHAYFADTEGANSGSPIIWDDEGVTIGIHTSGPCIPPVVGNSGTSFEYAPLALALDQFSNVNTVYVDSGSWANVQDGSALRPWHKVVDAINHIPSGGMLSIVEGNYNDLNERISFGADGKSMTIVAPVGTVRIGE